METKFIGERAMASTTSELETFWKPHIRAYQGLCVSHYSVFRSKLSANRLKLTLYQLYFLLFISSHIGLMYLDCKNVLQLEIQKRSVKNSPLIVLVNIMSAAGNFINHATLHIEAFAQGKNEKKMYQHFEEISEILKIKLNSPINCGILRKKYCKNFILFFSGLAIVMFVVTYYSIADGNKYFFVASRIYVVIVICSREMYIALILNVLGEFMVHFQICLSNEENDFPNRIRYYRQIYSKFGIITDLFSSCFGWSFITFLIQFTFDLINLSYWLYIDMTIVKVLPLCISTFFFKVFGLFDDKLHHLIMFCFPFVPAIIIHMIEIIFTFGYFCMLGQRCQNTASDMISTSSV